MEEFHGSTTLRQKPGGDGGVHGVSAALEDVDADLGGDGVRGGDGAVLDDDLVLVRPPDAACVQVFLSHEHVDMASHLGG